MTIASAPRSAASTIACATLPSLKSVLATSSPQSRPAPHEADAVVRRAARERRDVRPVAVLVGERAAGALGRVDVERVADLLSEVGVRPSTPESIVATRESEPSARSHASKRPMRCGHHWTGVPSGVPCAVSGSVSAGSFGAARGVARRSTATARTRGSAARRRRRARSDSPRRGRTVTSPISGTRTPSTRAAARATTGPGTPLERRRRAGARCARRPRRTPEPPPRARARARARRRAGRPGASQRA